MKRKIATCVTALSTVFVLNLPIIATSHYVQSHLEMTSLAQTALYEDRTEHPANGSIITFLNQDSGNGKTYFEYLLDGCRDADMRVNGIYNIDSYCGDYSSSDTDSDANTYYNPDYDYVYDYKSVGECTAGEVNYKDMSNWPVGDHGYHPTTQEGFYESEVDSQMSRIESSDRLDGLLAVLDGTTDEEKLTSLRNILMSSNARAMANEFYTRSRTAWSERRYIDAVYNLGIVIHLVQDMSAPPHVHCGEMIANPDFHDEFERLAWSNYLLPLNSTLPAGVIPAYILSEIGRVVHNTAVSAFTIPNDVPNNQIAYDDLRESVEIGIESTTAVISLFFCKQKPTASFMGLGYLPNTSSISFASSVSDDGTAVAGACESESGSEAFRWTKSGGMVGLGDLPGGDVNSSATSISGDGTVVVGYSSSDSGSEGFFWEQSSGMVGLGYLFGGSNFSIPTSVSHNGSTVVGYGSSSNGIEAFRWTQSTGIMGLGDLSGGWFDSSATSVSGDGSVVVGRGRSDAGMEAFQWTESNGMIGLGNIADGAFFYNALDISQDGSGIVGIANMSSGSRAFLWTTSDGMVDLGDIPDGSYNSYATAVSNGGSIVIGGIDTQDGHDSFVWDRLHGMQRTDVALTETYGIDLAGWYQFSAGDVSANGRTIVGTGFNPDGNQEAWIVEIPISIEGDLDLDEDADGSDVNSFIAAYSNNIYPDADINGDGVINSSDVASFAQGFGGN